MKRASNVNQASTVTPNIQEQVAAWVAAGNTQASWPGPGTLGTCPACGYCPHCGRGGYHTQPYWPYVQPIGPVWITQPNYTIGDTNLPTYTVTC